MYIWSDLAVSKACLLFYQRFMCFTRNMWFAVVTSSCNAVVNNNITYFVNPKFPGLLKDVGECSLTVKKMSENVGQIRLDFINFNLVWWLNTAVQCVSILNYKHACILKICTHWLDTIRGLNCHMKIVYNNLIWKQEFF